MRLSLRRRFTALVVAARRALGRVPASIGTPKPGPLRARIERAVEQLKDAQWEIRESETRYRDLLETQQDVIFRRDAQGQLSFVNDAYCRVFGASRLETVGQVFAPIVRAGDDAAPLLAQPERQHQRFAIEIETALGLKWYDFEEHGVSGGVDLANDPAGRQSQCVGRDITDQRRHEAELHDARIQADAANRAKSRFLAAMSHEIRTPLNGILGMGALLKETETTAEQRTYVSAMDRSARTLLALIDEILDFSKIEAGKLDLDETAFAVEDIVQSVVEMLWPKAREKNIELAWAIDPLVPRMGLGDDVRLRQIVTNLIGNAVKFTDHGGVMVTVTVEPPGTIPAIGYRSPQGMAGVSTDPRVSAVDSDALRLHITVADTGAGISAEAFKNLFAEFERGDETQRRQHSGTGLGLAISRRLARAMGGDIVARSVPGQGSEFHAIVHLKRHDTPMRRVAPTPGDHHVLLALNDGFERTALRLTLDGVHVAAAEVTTLDAQPVISAAAENDAAFTAVVADGNRPMHDIARLLATARATAKQATGAAVAGFVVLDQAPRNGFEAWTRAGFDGYLLRPVRPASLLERLSIRAQPTRAKVAPRQPNTVAPRATGQVLPVLLVEDNDINALLARWMLEKSGCRVTHVVNGLQAVDAVRASIEAGADAFDLVVMDVHMPVMDGLEAAGRMRTLSTTVGLNLRPVPPVIALTANAFPEDRQRCLDAGMDDYLSKPFERSELEAVLAKWVRQSAAA